MEGASTDSLRALAPKWSLAGDDQLLNLLQSTHKRIISKCEDVNSKLEAMASALGDANIHLQNVNNKFMALSNSQFIESRVYDDDADITTDTPAQVIRQPSPEDELSMLRASLAVLERAHDTAEIMDDTDSDSDAEISVVLKPKDMYSHRPLPYIIGSQPWRNKWHAGLVVEDSDTDSTASKQDGDMEQYSDSEDEVIGPHLGENTLSESSSPLGSVGGAPPPAPAPPAPPAPRPADVAAELARRLAGEPTEVQEEPEEYPAAASAQRKQVYKPEHPATSAIFSDEPPPLEQASELSSDDDIFAEINKHAPYTHRSAVGSKLADDLFSFEKPDLDGGDIFSDFAPTHADKPSDKRKSKLFEDESEPELFTNPPKKETQNKIEKDEPNTKKPVGGISLFGSNKGAESIGAAILKRNQRKSSISSDESESDDVKNRTEPRLNSENKPNVLSKNEHMDETDNKSVAKKEKDILDNLFSKPEKIQKKSPQSPKVPAKTFVKEKVTAAKEKEKTNVKDLFSDNLFDDIDDIFTKSVKIPTKESIKKSIFEDDDLFSDIDIAKDANRKKDNKEIATDNKNIFDSDDELFSDIKTDTKNSVTKDIEPHPTKDHVRDNSKITDKNGEVVSKVNIINKPTETIKERNLFDDSPEIIKSDPKPQIKSKTIFDSDSDDDIFSKIKTQSNEIANQSENILNSSKSDNKSIGEDIFGAETKSITNNQLSTGNIKAKGKELDLSPSLFEEDEIDDLFIAANKLKSKSSEKKDTNLTEVKNVSPLENKPVVEHVSIINKIDTTTEVYNTKTVESPKSARDQEPVVPKKSELNADQNITAGKNNIFDDDLLNDDLFSKGKYVNDKLKEKVAETAEVPSQEVNVVTETKKAIETEPKITKSQSTKTHKIEVDTKIKNQQHENVKQTIFNDLVGLSKEKETTVPKIPSSNADIFDDIFTEPPVFEKPAEPKKSKNVNALFDDDSDDESLFFKKDDVISDEKPEIFLKNANFGIFVDEPPAIDVDFTTKPDKNTDDEVLFNNLPNTVNDEQIIFSSEKASCFNTAENVDAVNEDLFSSFENNKNVPKTVDVDSNVDFNVPETQENVPDNIVKVVDDKPKTSSKTFKTQLQSDIFDKNEEKDLSSHLIDTENTEAVTNTYIGSDDELFASLPVLPKSSHNDQSDALKSDLKLNLDKHKANNNDIFKSELPKKDTETKKIGKINTKNFNINVNALIPGASPKKIPKERKDEQKSELEEPRMDKVISDETDFYSNNKEKLLSHETDFNPTLTSDRNENEETEKQESKPAKSTSFAEKSEPGVLDNNLSKQRPRIQVKRRPSSRKARREAVRKSAIDFGDDTDNSSSFDEHKPKNISKKIEKYSNSDEHLEDVNISKEKYDLSEEDASIRKQKETKKMLNDDNSLMQEVNHSIQSFTKDNDRDKENAITKEEDSPKENVSEEKTDIFESIVTNLPSHKDSAPSISNEIQETKQDVTQNENKTTTKIVYILNDEDIFNTESKNIHKSENIFGFKDSETNDIFISPDGIKTLGKTYKEDTEKRKNEETKSTKEESEHPKITKDVKTSINKASLFDDSDEELFNKNKKIVKKVTIFDSDSEEDLFSGKKSTEKKNKEVRNREVKERKEVVKGSLFGDDDDDDDLFGLKKDKTGTKHQSTPSTSKASPLTATASKTAEPVFDDPLSMLGDD